jgi:ribonuclease-3
VFRSPELLREALTHKSYLNEQPAAPNQDNERLEFLGDAVLDLVVSEFFVRRFPNAPEGDLSRLKASVVSEAALASVARELDLGAALALGRGEDLTGGRHKPSILANALEAVIAAVYLDGGLAAAHTVIERVFRTVLEDDTRWNVDAKTELQELCQRTFGVLPSYVVLQEAGPDHRKTFEVQLTIQNEIYGTGSGRSKKEAEQRAARLAIDRLRRR